MTKALSLRSDFDGPALRKLAKKATDATQVRRLLALAQDTSRAVALPGVQDHTR